MHGAVEMPSRSLPMKALYERRAADATSDEARDTPRGTAAAMTALACLGGHASGLHC
jgi:hypothetical protein